MAHTSGGKHRSVEIIDEATRREFMLMRQLGELMRTITRLVLLAALGFGGVVAFNYWSDGTWPSAPRAAALNSPHAREQAAKLANHAASVASGAASKAGHKLQEGGLTAKIKAKMALDDHVSARAIDVDTAGSVVTLSGIVASADARQRALRLAGETDGVTRVIDRLKVQTP